MGVPSPFLHNKAQYLIFQWPIISYSSVKRKLIYRYCIIRAGAGVRSFIEDASNSQLSKDLRLKFVIIANQGRLRYAKRYSIDWKRQADLWK